MSSFQSGRPETSAPFSSLPSSEVEPTPRVTPTSTAGQGEDDSIFIPHLFDFITLAAAVSEVNRPPVPSMFAQAQAVDSSVLIGYGASFTASMHRIPEDRDVEVSSEDKNGQKYVMRQNAQVRPTHVVYKTARIAFTSTGFPVQGDKRAMSSAMMEIFALVHPPLRKHPNIVKLLGLAWGSNPYEPSHRLPVLMVEYAQHGTLYDLQRGKQLDSEERRLLCLDVALGVDALHSCGLLHGDIKAENVLIFIDEKRSHIAKVADFGFSIVEAASNTAVYVGGTRPWKAPEANAPVPRMNLKATDIYSFGLLIWRVANDGESPFDLILPPDLTGDRYHAEIERLKQVDELKVRSKVEVWYLSYLAKAAQARGEKIVPSSELLSKLQTYAQEPNVNLAELEDADALFYGLILAMQSVGIDSSITRAFALRKAQLDCFYRLIDAVMDQCIGKDIESRSLTKVIKILSLDSKYRSSRDSSDILTRSFNHHKLSWARMRLLEPAVQAFVFNAFCSRQELDQGRGMINPPDCFLLASFYINGYGTEIDYAEAKRLLNFAAINHHEQSEAYVYRFWNALTLEFKVTGGLKNLLEVSALKGSRTALEDLKTAAPDRVASTMVSIRTSTAGQGANFYFKDQMLHGLAHWPWQDMLVSRSSIAEKLKGVKDKSNFRVNKRGDRILHIAASCGWSEAVEALIDTYSVPVNLLNDQGETALLSACRAGQPNVVHILLRLGADASISTTQNESPLHWLVSFEAEDVITIGEGLLKAGASKTRLPLSWAVHHDRADIVRFMLDGGRDVSIGMLSPSDNDSSPLLWAAHYHHAECLQLMCDALTRANITFTYGGLVYRAITSANTFSMILRHGDRYLEKLYETFDYLLTETSNTIFGAGIGLFGYTALYTAVTSLSDKVVEYLLSDHVKDLLFKDDNLAGRTSSFGVFHPAHMNQPCGVENRTPILESIRLNRLPVFNLLLAHGGDPLFQSHNPYNPAESNWTGLHIIAHAAHNQSTPPPLLAILLDTGIPVDGRPATATSPETPFSIALSNSALHLARHFLSHNAQINALSTNNCLLISEYPLTILGHTVAYTSRSTLTRLRFLLHDCSATVSDQHLESVVEPERGLTALQRAAWAYHGMSFVSPEGGPSTALRWEDIDWETNRSVIVALLERFGNEELITARCMALGGRTALHFAIEAGNVEGVKVLVTWDENKKRGNEGSKNDHYNEGEVGGAEEEASPRSEKLGLKNTRNDQHETPAEYAIRLFADAQREEVEQGNKNPGHDKLSHTISMTTSSVATSKREALGIIIAVLKELVLKK